MLLRAYRLTDKFSLLLLKSSTAAALLLVEGLSLLLGDVRAGHRRGVLGALSFVFRYVWMVVSAIAKVIGSVLFVVFGVARRGANVATGGAIQASADAMARRSARAEMDTGIVEDPLRAQNRILSGLVVVALAALIVMVLILTNQNQNRQPAIAALPLVDTLGGDPSAALQATGAAPTQSVLGGNNVFATSIPTATPLPDILQVRGTVAYTVRQNGQNDLWAVGVVERQPIRITNSLGNERDPAWSPDGRRLAYASNSGRNGEIGNWELYIADIFGGAEPQQMTYNLAFEANPTWSPDGVYLAYESYQGSNLDIYIMRADAASTEPPQRLPASSESADFSPAWAPVDGRNIAFVSWRDGNQDIYLVDLNTLEITNATNTPDRHEDHPSWSPDGSHLAYSALDQGIEKIFVKEIANLDQPPAAVFPGRTPSWSPDGQSVIAAVDTVDATHLTVYPFNQSGTPPPLIAVLPNASTPVWSELPLPAALVNAGGLPLLATELYTERETVSPTGDAPYRLQPLTNVQVAADEPNLSDRVNDSFDALRERVLTLSGRDFLGQLDDAFWFIDHRVQPGEPAENWHKTGRAFSINRGSAIVGFPPLLQVVREERGLNTYWRVYLRVDDDAQSGQLGEPLRHMPWDFQARESGDIDAYEAGGRLRDQMPEGYYVDLTQLAADLGWQPMPAESNWRGNVNGTNYWAFYKPDGLSWLEAMLEIYALSQLGGYAPTVTPAPTSPEDAAVTPEVTDAPAQ